MPAPAASTTTAAPKGPPGTCANGTKPAADGLIDDFESGEPAALGGRQSTWRLDAAERTTITIPGPKFASAEGGPTGSKQALHFAGKTNFQDQWGADAVVTFLKSGFYDASKYAGIAFKIRSEKPNFNPRVKITDVSSDPEGGLCTRECWNSFGKELVIGTEWQDVVMMWSDLTQQPGWGNPRPPAITQSKIKALDFSIYSGQDFDIWVDDIRFVECK
jgi:hypothetical protein